MPRPLVYYATTTFMGCFTCLILFNNMILGAVIAASFLSIMYFTIEKKFFYLVVCFFIIGTANYYSYFNINLPNSHNLKVRISDKNKFNCIAKIGNRKIILEGNVFNLIEGRNVLVIGGFEKNPVYEKGIVGTYKVSDYKICDEDLLSKINSFRSSLYIKFSQRLGKEKAAIVMAVCFGDSGFIEKTQKEDFKTLGISHVISVSGLHISIVYKALELVIGYKIALLLSLGYVIFTGGLPSTIRAFIMIFVLKVSSKVYKKYDSLSSISLSAIILLVIRPFYILDIGFMLSFLCVLGIILYNKKMKKVLYKLPKILNESVSLSISSQIFSMPYAVFALKTFSLGFVLSNLVLLPFYTVVVILGNMGMLSSLIYPVFNVINYGLFTVLMIIEIIQKKLTDKLPELIYFSYVDGLVVFGFYICYILIKKGYGQFKYVPLCIIIIFAFQNYKVFPEISYININNNDIVLIQYKMDTLAVTTGNITEKDLKVPIKINELVNGYKGNSVVKLGSRCIVKLNSSRNKIDVEVCFLKKTNKINDSEVFNLNKKENIQVMNSLKLRKDETYTPPGTIINKFIIIWNKAIKFP